MKPVTLSQLLATIGLILLSFTFQAHAKEYYKWVDSKGVTTYSATPPPTQKQDPQLDPTKKNINTTVTTASAINVSVANNKEQKNVPTVTTQTAKSTGTTNATSNATITAASEALIPVKNCNGVRCWDAKGKPYNLVAGTTYLSSTGGKCQKMGNSMRCSK